MWFRGNESAELIYPRYQLLPIMSLGRSVSTGGGPIEADIIVVDSFDELKQLPNDTVSEQLNIACILL